MRRQRSVWVAALVAAVVMLGGMSRGWAQDGGAGQEGRGGGMPGGGQMVRGTVTASSADTLTVKTETGEMYKVSVTANTRMMKARQPVKLTEIKAGDGVGAMGVMDAPNKTLHAMFVSVMDAEQVKKAQADLGKTYIAGQVTAMDELKLTIKRADGVVQVIEVDEGTSFRRGGRGMGMMGGAGSGETTRPRPAQPDEAAGAHRGGESITLADIKVGDSVIGRGALKNGVFVPTELGVMSPGGRRRSAGSGEPPSAGAGTPPQSVPR